MSSTGSSNFSSRFSVYCAPRSSPVTSPPGTFRYSRAMWRIWNLTASAPDSFVAWIRRRAISTLPLWLMPISAITKTGLSSLIVRSPMCRPSSRPRRRTTPIRRRRASSKGRNLIRSENRRRTSSGGSVSSAVAHAAFAISRAGRDRSATDCFSSQRRTSPSVSTPSSTPDSSTHSTKPCWLASIRRSASEIGAAPSTRQRPTLRSMIMAGFLPAARRAGPKFLPLFPGPPARRRPASVPPA